MQRGGVERRLLRELQLCTAQILYVEIRGWQASTINTHFLLVVVTVVVHAAVEAVTRHHPLLLHQALEAKLRPTVRIAHQLHQAGHHAADVPVVCF